MAHLRCGVEGTHAARALQDKGRVVTYGEVDPASFLVGVLPRMSMTSHDSPLFFDLGSGNGALVLAVGACTGVPTFGVEVVERRHAAAEAALLRARATRPDPFTQVCLLYGDARVLPLPPVTHVFVNNFVFDAALNAALFARLASMPSVRVVSAW